MSHRTQQNQAVSHLRYSTPTHKLTKRQKFKRNSLVLAEILLMVFIAWLALRGAYMVVGA